MQANDAMDRDVHKHFLKPEQEVRNYFLALNLLEEKLKVREPFSKKLLLEVQAMVEKGACPHFTIQAEQIHLILKYG